MLEALGVIPFAPQTEGAIEGKSTETLDVHDNSAKVLKTIERLEVSSNVNYVLMEEPSL